MPETTLYPKKNLSKETLYRWYNAIAENRPIVADSGKMLMDYEAAAKLQEHLDFYSMPEVSINAPYIMITPQNNDGIPTPLIAMKMDVDVDKITEIGNSFIINCKEIVPPTMCACDRVDRDSFARDFIEYMLEVGNIDNHYYPEGIDDFADDIRELCENEGIIVAAEDRQIAIAFDEYIENAKNTIGEMLNLSRSMFVEVSHPYSTVLVIDCEKLYLATEHYVMETEQWFY